MRAVVTGTIATYPVGGVAWDYGQYAIGLERLGFDVYYLEDTGLCSYDAAAREWSEDCSYGVTFLEQSLATFSPSLADRWHFRNVDGQTHGLDASTVAEIVSGADLFLNHSGQCLLREEYLACPRKVFLDTDPGWNHFVILPKWDATPVQDGCYGFRAHDYFFTYAQRIGQPDCRLPTLDIPWQPTRPAVVRDCWPLQPSGNKWTTVMSWANYQKPIEHDGMTYGAKEVEFARIEELPSRTTAVLELAIAGVNPPLERLRALGWSVVDGTVASETAESYRSYIQDSRGELSVAKNVYVATRSGWFSFRSCCYLASGRPVVLQDTGFSDHIPTGDGLLAFSDLDEAVRSISAVEAEYVHHQEAARELARTHFDSDSVLTEMLDRIGLG
jgi:hypothetical protein